MHYSEITEEILKIRQTKGKTPSQSVRVELAKDARIVRTDKGIYSLKEWKKTD